MLTGKAARSPNHIVAHVHYVRIITYALHTVYVERDSARRRHTGSFYMCNVHKVKIHGPRRNSTPLYAQFGPVRTQNSTGTVTVPHAEQCFQNSQRLHSHPFLLRFMLAPPCVALHRTHSSPTLPPLGFLHPLREDMSGAEGTFPGPRLRREDYITPRLLRAALAQSSPRRRGYTHDTT